jgi:hypothetical protein
MARGVRGLPKVSPGPAMPYPSMPCRRATPETALRPFQRWPAHGACSLQTSSTPLDTLYLIRLWLPVTESKGGIWHGVSKSLEDGHSPPAFRADHSWNGHEAISGIAHSQGIERLGMAGPDETLGSPWPTLCKAEKQNKYNFKYMSNCQIIKLSNCQIVKLSNCQIVKLSNCQIFKLSNCQIVGRFFSIQIITQIVFFLSVMCFICYLFGGQRSSQKNPLIDLWYKMEHEFPIHVKTWKCMLMLTISWHPSSESTSVNRGGGRWIPRSGGQCSKSIYN